MTGDFRRPDATPTDYGGSNHHCSVSLTFLGLREGAQVDVELDMCWRGDRVCFFKQKTAYEI